MRLQLLGHTRPLVPEEGNLTGQRNQRVRSGSVRGCAPPFGLEAETPFLSGLTRGGVVSGQPPRPRASRRGAARDGSAVAPERHAVVAATCLAGGRADVGFWEPLRRAPRGVCGGGPLPGG